MTFQELQLALDLFGLGERATLAQIKSRHRLLVKRHHPDSRGNVDSSDDKKIQEINNAYKILFDYCNRYRYSFSRKEFMRQCPEEHLKEQFSNDPAWSSGSEDS